VAAARVAAATAAAARAAAKATERLQSLIALIQIKAVVGRFMGDFLASK
jgi:uncharacterized membrane protein